MIAARALAAVCRFRVLQRQTHTITHTSRTTQLLQQQQLTLSAEYSSSTHTHRFDVQLLVSVLRQENVTDICVIRVPHALKYCEYLIIASGTSPRHLNATTTLLLRAYKFVREAGDPQVRVEGRDSDEWKCIDFGSMVIHLMLPEIRDAYELEKLWTLRSYDEQLSRIPEETLPSDFIYDIKPE